MSTDVTAEVSEAELLAISSLCDGLPSVKTDGGRMFIYMPSLRFIVNGAMQTMDALLCLNHTNPSYPTKLYLPAQLGCGLNWNESAYILGRHWHTFSWGNVTPDQRPLEILAAHLAPLNQG